MKSAPQRWSEDASLEVPRALRQAVADARGDGPSAAQLARLIDAVAVSAPASAAPLAGASRSSVLLKLSGSLVAAFALGFAAMRFLAPATVPRDTAPHVEPARPVPRAMPEAIATKTEPVAGAPQLEPPVVERPVSSPARRVLRPLTPPQQHAAAPGASIAELELLQRAKRSLASAPRETLALVEAHRRDFPRGAFAEERQALSIEALHALGQTARAAKQLAAFRARYPQSAYLRRLDALMGQD